LKRIVEREPRVALGGCAAALTLGYVMGRFQRPAAGSPGTTTMSRTDLNVVFLPGLGADGRLFASQREVFPEKIKEQIAGTIAP